MSTQAQRNRASALRLDESRNYELAVNWARRFSVSEDAQFLLTVFGLAAADAAEEGESVMVDLSLMGGVGKCLGWTKTRTRNALDEVKRCGALVAIQ